MRQIVLDTETTGLEVSEGHKIIEIGCVEMIDRQITRNELHHFINPQRDIDSAALEVHGINQEMLTGKPLFADIAGELLAFIDGAELIVHNAPFDVGFLNYEFSGVDGFAEDVIGEHCTVFDTLDVARKMHPGRKNSLDALCRRYEVDGSSRTLHGALLDAKLLAEVYLKMTGGQTSLLSEPNSFLPGESETAPERTGDTMDLTGLLTVKASQAERDLHRKWLELLRKEVDGKAVWDKLF